MRQFPGTVMKLSLFLVLFSILIFICLIPDSAGRILIVDEDEGEEFQTIQDAIDNSTDGDTIRVYAGNYNEHITVNTSITIIGNGTGDTVVDGGGGEAVTILIEAENVTVKNLTISGGGCCHGAGIKVKGNNTTIMGNEITENALRGIYLLNCSGAVIKGNQVHENGWGVHAFRSERSLMEDNTVRSNGLGIFLEGSGNCTLSRNTCANNEQTGVSVRFSNNIDIVHGHMHNNIYYGLDIRTSSHINVINCAILNNEGYFGVGIFFAHTGFNTVYDCIISGNDYGISIRGAMYGNSNAYPVGPIDLHNNSIHGNSEAGLLVDEESTFSANATMNWWGVDSGPYHPTHHPGGKGDEITEGVDFYPWIGTVFMEPRVEITQPKDNYFNGTIIINGTADDPDGTVEFVELAMDDGIWIRLNGTESWSYTLNYNHTSWSKIIISVRSFDGEYFSAQDTMSLYFQPPVPDDWDPDGNKDVEYPADDDESMILEWVTIEPLIAAFILFAIVRKRKLRFS